ncbi:hypothetical protein BDSB_21825 [Burkholderia dolosa PC543]|nr:hypothetical protein BDSB_21825 [Burkholderia dolosa PC543]
MTSAAGRARRPAQPARGPLEPSRGDSTLRGAMQGDTIDER